MKQFSWFLLVIHFRNDSLIFNISILLALFAQLGFSDDDVCADRPKVLECFHKMTSTAQNPDGSLMSIGFPVLNATQFEQQCRAGDVWNKCVNEKNLRQSCAKDLLFVQADGSTGYICREPQKSGRRLTFIYIKQNFLE